MLNQINVASCCVIPKDLNAFAKENDIRLVTTSDPHGKYLVKQISADRAMMMMTIPLLCRYSFRRRFS